MLNLSRRRRFLPVGLTHPSAAGPSSLLTGIVSYWKMDEASGTRVDSVLTTGNDLADNNTVTQNPGKIAGAGQFTAANSEFLSRASNASLQTGDIAFTWAGWVYLDSLVNGTMLAKWGTDAGSREYISFFNHDDHAPNDRFTFGVSTDGNAGTFVDATTFGAPSTATWYHLGMWHDPTANTINIRVNNGAANSAAFATGVRSGATTFVFGRLGSASLYYLNGRWDEVGFWKRLLTDQEWTTLYNGGNGMTYPFAA